MKDSRPSPASASGQTASGPYLSDESLITRVLKTDDRSAFSELVLRHQSSVRRFLRHLTRGNTAEADDLSQESFVEAFQKLATFRGNSAFVSWLLGIAYNRYRNAWRRQRTAQNAAPLLQQTQPNESETRSSDLRQDMATALRQLTLEDQTIIHLCYHQGLSHQEVSTVLACPVGTIKTQIARAKLRLQTLLSPWNPQP